MIWLSFTDFMSLSLATKLQFRLFFWFENASATLFVVSWHVFRDHPVCSPEEQCIPKAGCIHALIQRNGGMVIHFRLLKNL